MESMLRIFIPIYLVTMLLAVFVVRSVLVWRRTGINVVTLWRKEGVEGITGRGFRLLPVLSIVVGVSYAVDPALMRYFGPIHWLQQTAVQVTGLALMLVSFLFIVVAQHQMGRSWRIGIDEDNPTGLVREGLFALSRNPIFLGMLVNSLGFFLVLPNAVTLLILGVSYALIQVQIRLEEDFLRNRLGEPYRSYLDETPRWLGLPRR